MGSRIGSGCLLLLAAGCFVEGDRFDFKMNRDRTSSVITETSLQVRVRDVDELETNFQLSVFVRPIIGQPRTNVSTQAIPNASISEDTLLRLRSGEVLEGDNYRLTHVGYDDTQSGDFSCDKLLLDKIPDTQDTQDLSINVVWCWEEILGDHWVPRVDLHFFNGPREINLGFDSVAR